MREERVEVDDGAGLHVVTEGRGRPVVWCHGGPGGTDTLGRLAALSTDVTTAHRYDQRACGRSSGGRPFTVARWVADLEALREHWGYRRWVVGGHSFGAGLALAYALEHPAHTEAVVYLSCVLRLAGQPDWEAQFRRARVERIPAGQRSRYLELRRRRDEQGGLPPALAAELGRLAIGAEFVDQAAADRAWPRLAAELAAVNPEVHRELGADFARYVAAAAVRARLRALDVPVLLVHGRADPRPVAAVEALAGVLRRAELVTLPDVGHFPFLEAPGALRQVLRRFLLSPH
jgi:proline iminopeptidase